MIGRKTSARRSASWLTATRVSALLGYSLLSSSLLAQEDEVGDGDSAAEGRIIGEITLVKHDVFDLSDPRENKRLFRAANRLHIVTKDHVIEQQLLLEPGDVYKKQLADETERILRRTSYLYDAAITPTVRDDGKVDLEVETRDVWTLRPALSLSRSGGENETSYGFEELNLLGRGQTLKLEHFEDVDRESDIFEFRDPQIGNTWVSGSLYYSDNSDGQTSFLSIVRPFYALDTRWAAGITGLDDDRVSTFYAQGDPVAEYRHDRQQYSVFAGWSKGRRGGWVRRYTAGFAIDDNRFTEPAEPLRPALVPPDRNLRYPFVGFEIFADEFATSRNRDQMARTEDIFMGARFTGQLGWASESLDSDRDALLYSATASRGFGTIDKKALLLSARASGRLESGAVRNGLVSLNARYFWQQTDKRVFFTAIDAAHGHRLDPEGTLELGGDTGLRGYPLRYQSGDARVFVTAEQRYYWNWYPWRLFRVGGAIFADAGRTWGDNPVADESLGWLKDVGVGLRFASTRSSVRRVIHLDVAVPLDGDASIDDVQILLESKRGF